MNEDDKKSQLLKTDTLNERQDNLPPIRCSSSCLPTNQVSPGFFVLIVGFPKTGRFYIYELLVIVPFLLEVFC